MGGDSTIVPGEPGNDGEGGGRVAAISVIRARWPDETGGDRSLYRHPRRAPGGRPYGACFQANATAAAAVRQHVITQMSPQPEESVFAGLRTGYIIGFQGASSPTGSGAGCALIPRSQSAIL